MSAESALVVHAESELRRAGLFDPNSDYNGDIGYSVLHLVKEFARQGHSGASAAMTSTLFNELVHFNAIAPLTDNPDEWMEVADGIWQSNRQADAFSKDGGKTYYLVDNAHEVFKAEGHR